MVLYRFEDKEPKIGERTYVSQSAEVIGDITIGKQCYIGPGAKIRGDYGSILIGNKTSIEENCVLHARPSQTCKVGNMVTVGHGSILHNCTVKDYAVIGMGAIVSDYAVVGVWSVVGEGCVVKNKQVIEDRKIVVGIPAKIVGEVSKGYQKLWTSYKNLYAELALKYPQKLEIVKRNQTQLNISARKSR
ncbi:MAG: gamma carbonic anhydrase family protein [Candidatus Bathyarchaeota archaeon]|nr:gamma carbonic anhydrase family protein [Candidatus Bathyarchaeota archaeon]